VFEFDKHDVRQGPGARPRAAYTPFEGGRRRALLLWGEHCTECAAPDCYTSCNLYSARPDTRCRRFEYGVYRNRNFRSAAGHGAEVVFRRWGKIEAHGNAALFPASLVSAAERAAQLAAPLADGLGSLVRRVSGDGRWSWLSFSLLERLNRRLARRSGRPDAFVAEIYNPGDAPVTLLLSMAVDRTRLANPLAPSQLPRPLLRTLTIPPGYFREDIPAAEFERITSSGLPFSIALTPGAEDGTHLVFLSLDLIEYGRATEAAAPSAATARPAAKCVVFDLDNTLWDGILLEGSVQLRASVTETFRTLDERGILMSVVSKNAPEDALAQLRRFGLEDYLLHPQIGWGPKSEGVRRVAERLDIGIDSLIFVDDNPFERAEVFDVLPAVEVLPDTALATLLDHPRLQGAVTDESRRRRSMYKEAGARAEAAASYGDDYQAFLRECRIEVEIRPPLPEDRERVTELVQRTNQLNFSGRKYRGEEVEALLADRTREKYVVRCRDRYGDYGIVGFCLAAPAGAGLRIEDLMLSCRVQGKFVEQALFAHLARRPGWSARFIEVNFVPTARNGAARAVLDALGFATSEADLLRRDVAPGEGAPDIVRVEGSWDALIPVGALSPVAA
jgi:FkbH-like protein